MPSTSKLQFMLIKKQCLAHRSLGLFGIMAVNLYSDFGCAIRYALFCIVLKTSVNCNLLVKMNCYVSAN